MQTKYGFTGFSIAEFEAWIAGISVTRSLSFLQIHHTWLPSYANFNGSNAFEMQRSMKEYHVGHNGWSDIGQHLSIFPDGMVMTGRPMNATPACIFGNNSRAICIENVGDFDIGKDQMTAAHQDSLIRAARAILTRFSSIAANDQGVVYHHWFDLGSGQRTNGAGNTKSCPGTAFFGGNSVADFNANFLPMITGPAPNPVANPVQPLHRVAVTANALNIRQGPGTNFAKVSENGPAELGSILRVWAEQAGWLKVANSKEHWVFGQFTEKVRAARVNTADTNIRSGPGTGFGVVEVRQPGFEVFVREEQGNWSRVGPDLWVNSGLISLS